MKLASLKSKSNNRDGELIIVNKDLTIATSAVDIVPTLQQALDNWVHYYPKLQKRYQQLNIQPEILTTFPFNPSKVAAPLPRAYQWADGSAYVNHVELVRKARGASMPENFWHDPLMYQGGSDNFIGPTDDILVADINWGIDFESEIAIITDDVPMGIDVEAAKSHIKLLMLANDVSLRNLIPNELSKGFGFFQSKPATAFSPVAITPDELDQFWDGYTINLPLLSYLNNQLIGQPNAGIDMTFDFPTLIAHAAKTRFLAAGTIIGSGTVSNIDKTTGSSCLAECRMLEIIEHGKASTPFLQWNDQVKIEMLDMNKQSIFGAIQQKVAKYDYPL